jgi:hypothetical protein
MDNHTITVEELHILIGRVDELQAIAERVCEKRLLLLRKNLGTRIKLVKALKAL